MSRNAVVVGTEYGTYSALPAAVVLPVVAGIVAARATLQNFGSKGFNATLLQDIRYHHPAVCNETCAAPECA
jgi:hypothetical protein